MIDNAISQSGRRPAFLDTRGVILTRLGRLDDAIENLVSARDAASIIVDGQPLPAIHFHLARTYMLANQPAKAKESFESGIKLGLTNHQLEASEQEDFQKLTASR